MASPAANPGGQTPAQKQEKHFGPPVLGKKLFKAKAKGLNADRFMTLPKGVTYFTDNKEKEKINAFVKAALDGEYSDSYDSVKRFQVWELMSEDEKSEIEWAKEQGYAVVSSIGDLSGHKVLFSEYDEATDKTHITEVYMDDIQYQALLATVNRSKLYYDIILPESVGAW